MANVFISLIYPPRHMVISPPRHMGLHGSCVCYFDIPSQTNGPTWLRGWKSHKDGFKHHLVEIRVKTSIGLAIF